MTSELFGWFEAGGETVAVNFVSDCLTEQKNVTKNPLDSEGEGESYDTTTKTNVNTSMKDSSLGTVSVPLFSDQITPRHTHTINVDMYQDYEYTRYQVTYPTNTQNLLPGRAAPYNLGHSSGIPPTPFLFFNNPNEFRDQLIPLFIIPIPIQSLQEWNHLFRTPPSSSQEEVGESDSGL